MSAVLRSEVVRLTTVPAPVVATALVALGSLVLIGVTSALVPAEEVPGVAALLTVPPTLAAVALLVLGALGGTSDFQHRTADMTFLARPRRAQVLASRAVVYAVLGVLLAAVSSAACTVLADTVLAARSLELPNQSPLAATSALTVVAGALCAALGVGVGYAVRSSVPAVLGILGWVTVAEGLLGSVVPAFLMPLGAVRVLGAGTGVDATATAVAAAVLAAYAAAALGLGVRSLRRDIEA